MCRGLTPAREKKKIRAIRVLAMNARFVFNLEQGLAEMWSWAKEQPMRERLVWSNYEIEKGIYEFWRSK